MAEFTLWNCLEDTSFATILSTKGYEIRSNEGSVNVLSVEIKEAVA
jgi:hypothetical protein